MGEQLDIRVQNYVKALCKVGTPIGSSVVIAVAQGLISATDRTLLEEYGGHTHSTHQDLGYVSTWKDGVSEAQGNNQIHTWNVRQRI